MPADKDDRAAEDPIRQVMEVYDLPFSATQRSNAVLAAQAIEHNLQKKPGPKPQQFNQGGGVADLEGDTRKGGHTRIYNFRESTLTNGKSGGGDVGRP